MSRRNKYPRLGTFWPANPNSQRICQVGDCGLRATAQQFIEWSWFRGDDEGIWVCHRHAHTEDEVILACRETLRCRLENKA